MSMGSSTEITSNPVPEPSETATSDDRVNILMVDDQPGKLLTYEAILSDLGENLIEGHRRPSAWLSSPLWYRPR